TNVPPQHFCDHGLETRAGAEGTFPKGAKIGVKCRTPEPASPRTSAAWVAKAEWQQWPISSLW
ncbi:MAG TPA: hypothetical protein PK667_11630, partial [Nitrosomonas europaea]|uniref:hypothetical protein n=1 Tax=Nitrosomonas europaea TaxID=915 RepID=UPI002CE6E54B